MKIRDLTPSDFDAFNSLMFELHNHHVSHRPDIFKKIEKPTDTTAWNFETFLNDENTLMLGAELNGEIVGICVVILRHPKNPVLVPRTNAYIDSICVGHKYRKRGIGTAIYKEATRRAKERGAESIELGVSDFNTSAISFYKSLGMTVQNYKMEQKI